MPSGLSGTSELALHARSCRSPRSLLPGRPRRQKMLASMFAAAPATAPPVYPYPQDCSSVTGASPPTWFKDCNATLGGCFEMTIPSRDLFSVGNTSRTVCDSTGHCNTLYGHGAQWCIDHINRKMYTKAVVADAVMFFEIDNSTQQPVGTNANSCRMIVGKDGDVTDARVYATDRLLCSAVNVSTSNNITYVNVGAGAPTKLDKIAAKISSLAKELVKGF
jgi:hypothetical protein